LTISTDSHDQSSAPDLSSDPYAYFAYMRKTAPVWRGTLMESDLLPPELKNAENWTLFDFESVFTAFREDTVFGSEMYLACTASSITTIAALSRRPSGRARSHSGNPR
jgi:hypothetical protein